MTMDFSNAVWANAPEARGRGHRTVSEKVDVYVTHSMGAKTQKNPKEYLVIRFFAKKYKEVFGDAERLSVGWFGNYLLIKAGDEHKVYNSISNPEVRIDYATVKECGRNPETMFGGYLLKVDEAAGMAYVDLSVGARA